MSTCGVNRNPFQKSSALATCYHPFSRDSLLQTQARQHFARLCSILPLETHNNKYKLVVLTPYCFSISVNGVPSTFWCLGPSRVVVDGEEGGRKRIPRERGMCSDGGRNMAERRDAKQEQGVAEGGYASGCNRRHAYFAYLRRSKSFWNVPRTRSLTDSS